MSTPHYPAQGLQVEAATFVEQFFLDAGTTSFENHVVTAGTYEAGAILGQITATGLLVLADPAAGDGSEVPMGILMESLDSTADDELSILVGGSRRINYNALRPHASFTELTLRPALRKAGLFTTTPLYSGKL